MQLIFRQFITETADTATFVFSPKEPFIWQAGQSIKIALPGRFEPLEHRFTISSAPREKAIHITTRRTNSDFKHLLWRLRPGDTVDASSLDGAFIWREHPNPPMFLAGGIGITPFRSMLMQRLLEGRLIPATLIYSSLAADAPFKSLFTALAQDHLEFTFIHQTKPIQQKAIGSIAKGLIYISGPTAMVDALSSKIIAWGIPESQLVRDWFTENYQT